jgi:hypothetical protein
MSYNIILYCTCIYNWYRRFTRHCVYHAHIPDLLNGGSPRNTDVDLVNYSGENVVFNAGDAVDMNVQRTLVQ